MRNIIAIFLVITVFIINAQNTDKFIKYKSNNAYAFIPLVDFDSQTMIDCDNPYFIFTFGEELKDYVYLRNHAINIVEEEGFASFKNNYN